VVIESSSVVEHAAITVTDVVGNTIYTTTNTTLQGTFSLPLSLTKGLYLITISNDQGSMTKKLLKN